MQDACGGEGWVIWGGAVPLQWLISPGTACLEALPYFTLLVSPLLLSPLPALWSPSLWGSPSDSAFRKRGERGNSWQLGHSWGFGDSMGGLRVAVAGKALRIWGEARGLGPIWYWECMPGVGSIWTQSSSGSGVKEAREGLEFREYLGVQEIAGTQEKSGQGSIWAQGVSETRK